MSTRVSSKLILAVAVVSIATIGVFSYLLTDAQHRAMITQVEHNANQISETIKSSTQQDMRLNRRDDLHRMIDTIGRQDGIEGVRIFNKEGEIIYSAEADVIGTLVDKRAEACYACHAADRPLERLPVAERTRVFRAGEDHRQLGIINPIYNDPSCWQAACHAHTADQTVLGVLDITMSLEDVDRQLVANWIKVALLAATAVLALSLIVWWWIESRVGKPVAHLVDATRKVASGDLGHEVHVHRQDELGRLADSFNEMTRTLAEQQQQLYQSDKLASVGRLAAGVAHEINNPLTGVLTYGSFLLNRTDDPEVKKDLETIVRETKRCRQIVKGLLDFSRQVRPKKTRVDLHEVIRRAITIVRNRLTLNDITVTVDVAKNLPEVHADRGQMAQVMINLLVNATDAIGREGGEITIQARPKTTGGITEVVLEVKDTGCGIPPEGLGKVFEPFYTTKSQEGTGLGLAIVWGIVNKHDGTVELASEVGRGTTVTVHLPVGSGAPAIVAEECA